MFHPSLQGKLALAGSALIGAAAVSAVALAWWLESPVLAVAAILLVFVPLACIAAGTFAGPSHERSRPSLTEYEA